jgi:uncharacterized protein (TIGR04255 family)
VSKREVYPNALIVLVAIEIRHPTHGPLDRSQVLQLSTLIREVLPLPDEVTMVTVELQAGPDRQPTQRQTVMSVPRWTTRDKRTALTIRGDGLVIETSRYHSYEQMRKLLDLALRARTAVSAPAGVERIGLRYIDEIRVPVDKTQGEPAWQEWVDPSLLGPVHIGADLGLTAAGGEGLAVFSGDGDKALVLRYGVQDDYAVQSTPQLRRPLPPPGPLFKLDIDSYWQPGNEVPEFTVDSILDCADELHEPVNGVFESLISDRLREEVLRRG